MIAPPKLGLYIHFPWCISKCPYCDFNSHALNHKLDQESYIKALISDLEQDIPQVWRRVVHSIFMGGGTPSLFSAQSMQTLLSQVRALVQIAPDAEISMEVNPGSQEFDRLEDYLATGINRLSFGIQSLDDSKLKTLKRIHNAQQAIAAVKKAKTAGYTNFNLDMMFGLPRQTLREAKTDLKKLIELDPPHISYYQLTIEANTLFAAKPPKKLPNNDLLYDMYLQGMEILAGNGYQQYEVSAYAKKDHQCQHNLNYWQFGDYLGIGAGAHGKITMGHSGEIHRTVKQKLPRTYLQTAISGERIVKQEILNQQQIPFEYMLNHLRIKKPVYWSHYESCTGTDRAEPVKILQVCGKNELFYLDNEKFELNEQGFLLSDEILKLFI
ncbi:MAG: radical SAM family heme chaperone HemW [Proteobacteria bacterium]|nr:radical SAM family heme chaperone HemW [Pseudomonadota bacterium]